MTSTTLQNGMIVQHASLGIGRVVALERDAVHVFFAGVGEPFATKLRLPLALSFLAPSTTPNAWLSGLPSFTRDASTGRYGRAGASLSHADAVARFLEVFPAGFSDPRYVDATDGRGGRWRRAHATYVETLGGGQAKRLLAAGDASALLDRALQVERQVRTLHGRAEKTSIADGSRNAAAVRTVFAALLDVVAAAPERDRFEALAVAVAAVAPGVAPEARWPMVTLLPFVARPEAHMVLRPRVTCEIALRLGLDLAYDAEPNWTTYSALLESTERLLEKLRPLGARDHFDVEAFLHASGTKSPRPKAVKAKGAAAEEPRS